jgi:hypothetical protein
MKHKLFERVWRLLHWFFGAPFQGLPPEFGDLVPPELRTFEAKTGEDQYFLQQEVPWSSGHYEQTRPTKQDKFFRKEQHR